MRFRVTNMRIVCSERRRSGSSRRIGNGPFHSSVSAKLWQLIRSIFVKVCCVGSKTQCNQCQEENGIDGLPKAIYSSNLSSRNVSPADLLVYCLTLFVLYPRRP